MKPRFFGYQQECLLHALDVVAIVAPTGAGTNELDYGRRNH